MSFKIINLDTINQSMMGNKELIKQLIDLYIVQSPTDFKALEDAIISGDIEVIQRRAHHIKPTMQYIGADNLLQHFQILETKAKERASITEIEDLFYQIKPKFLLMLDELHILSIS
jgi:HPt (histidine-containing phosphotransfer) domain-containing protein